MGEPSWRCLRFEELKTEELYDALALRNEVFVGEQRIVFADTDYKDQEAWHVLGYDEEGKCVAYCRFFAPGTVYEGAAIGRVCNSSKVRGKGVGKALMRKAQEEIYRLFGPTILIELSAQAYLRKFYSDLGYEHDGKPEYVDAGIMHIHMHMHHKES
jgi:ElaA protein